MIDVSHVCGSRLWLTFVAHVCGYAVGLKKQNHGQHGIGSL
jgi:hypothetical protein